MGIWIRSQDGHVLIEAQAVTISQVTGVNDLHYIFADNNWLLGEYDSASEALAVLNQIQDYIKYLILAPGQYPVIYQMPEAGFSRIPKEYRCVVCGVNPVDVDAGYDTCPTCAGRT